MKTVNKLKYWSLAILMLSACADPDPQDHEDYLDFATKQRSSHPLSAVSRNPFAGSWFYVNSDYAKNIDKSLALVPKNSHDALLMQEVKKYATAIWLDRIAAIKGGSLNDGRLSLAQHFDQALLQGKKANQTPVVLLVVYDLPDRDCAALASNGELTGLDGLARYKSEFIDEIYRVIESKPAYQNINIVLILEPDSLPNMVTNTEVSPTCGQANALGLYQQGISYAISKLGALDNVYIYLDIAHSAWLGWPAQMAKAVALYVDLIKKATCGDFSLIRGFATDIANYTPLREPFLNANEIDVLSSPFYQYNPDFDELSYIKNLGEKFSAAGLTDFGFIIDTSRNGWAIVNDGHPIDHRKDRGNWCNVGGSGIGERPRANPGLYKRLDAFVFVKPPGESDGISHPIDAQNSADAEGKRFDAHCDANNPHLDALPNAPSAGSWFHENFLELVRNATPAIVPTPAPVPKPTPAPVPKPTPAPKPTTASVVSSANCKVTVQQQSIWQEGNALLASLSFQVENTSAVNIPVPWSLLVTEKTSKHYSQAWNWDIVEQTDEAVTFVAKESWQSLNASSSGQISGVVVRSVDDAFEPDSIVLNGQNCQVVFKK